MMNIYLHISTLASTSHGRLTGPMCDARGGTPEHSRPSSPGAALDPIPPGAAPLGHRHTSDPVRIHRSTCAPILETQGTPSKLCTASHLIPSLSPRGRSREEVRTARSTRPGPRRRDPPRSPCRRGRELVRPGRARPGQQQHHHRQRGRRRHGRGGRADRRGRWCSRPVPGRTLSARPAHPHRGTGALRSPDGRRRRGRRGQLHGGPALDGWDRSLPHHLRRHDPGLGRGDRPVPRR